MREQRREWTPETREEQRQWGPEGLPLVEGRVSLPTLPEELRGRGPDRFRRYYAAQEQAFLRRCERVLLPRAEAAAQIARERSRPVRSLRAELVWQPTLARPGLLSLWTELREEGQVLCRWGDTWDTASGLLLPLEDLFPQGRVPRHRLLGLLRAQLPSPAPVRRFDPRRYYLTEDGPVLFYLPGVLGPGVSAFPLPWSPEGPRLPQT